MWGSAVDFELCDAGATDALGAALARSFPSGAVLGGAGAVLYLDGELGAGKTACVRSLLRAWGVAGLVRSPTYTLVESYPLGELTCVHVDLYRLLWPAEVDDLGLRDFLGAGCVLLIEWPEKGGSRLPPADLELSLRYVGVGRAARLRAHSGLGVRWLENLRM